MLCGTLSSTWRSLYTGGCWVNAGVKPQLCCSAFDVCFCGTLEQEPHCTGNLSHLRVCTGMKLQTKVPPGSSTSASQETWHTHQLSSPRQSSFSINSAGSHYSWQSPEAQREKTHRDQPSPFPEAGTTAVTTTAESLRLFRRSAAQQGSQKASEQACIPSHKKQQQLCTPERDLLLYRSLCWGILKCLHFCSYFKQLL